MLGKDLAKYCESNEDCRLCEHKVSCDNFGEMLQGVFPEHLLSHDITEDFLKLDF